MLKRTLIEITCTIQRCSKQWALLVTEQLTNGEEITNSCLFLLKLERNKPCLQGCFHGNTREGKQVPVKSLCSEVTPRAFPVQQPGTGNKQSWWCCQCGRLDPVCYVRIYSNQEQIGGRGEQICDKVLRVLLENQCIQNTFPEKQQQQCKVRKLFILSF